MSSDEIVRTLRRSIENASAARKAADAVRLAREQGDDAILPIASPRLEPAPIVGGQVIGSSPTRR